MVVFFKPTAAQGRGLCDLFLGYGTKGVLEMLRDVQAHDAAWTEFRSVLLKQVQEFIKILSPEQVEDL